MSSTLKSNIGSGMVELNWTFFESYDTQRYISIASSISHPSHRNVFMLDIIT